MKRSFHSALLAVTVMLVMLFLSTVCFADQEWVITVNNNVKLYSAPDSSSSVIYLCPSGYRFQLLSRTKLYFKIQTSDGRVGYLRKGEAIISTPPAYQQGTQPAQAPPPQSQQPMYIMPYQKDLGSIPHDKFATEWRIRTLRSLGFIELGWGVAAISTGLAVMVLGGIAADADAGVGTLGILGGMVLMASGGLSAYLGYQDLERAYKLDKDSFWGKRRSSLDKYNNDGKEKTTLIPVYGFKF